jgi:hypothetical protein
MMSHHLLVFREPEQTQGRQTIHMSADYAIVRRSRCR